MKQGINIYIAQACEPRALQKKVLECISDHVCEIFKTWTLNVTASIYIHTSIIYLANIHIYIHIYAYSR